MKDFRKHYLNILTLLDQELTLNIGWRTKLSKTSLICNAETIEDVSRNLSLDKLKSLIDFGENLINKKL